MVSSTKTTKDSTKAIKESKKSFGLSPVHKVLEPNNMGSQQYILEPHWLKKREEFTNRRY